MERTQPSEAYSKDKAKLPTPFPNQHYPLTSHSYTDPNKQNTTGRSPKRTDTLDLVNSREFPEWICETPTERKRAQPLRNADGRELTGPQFTSTRRTSDAAGGCPATSWRPERDRRRCARRDDRNWQRSGSRREQVVRVGVGGCCLCNGRQISSFFAHRSHGYLHTSQFFILK